MEKESKLTQKFKRTVLGMAAGSLLAIAAINGSKPAEIKTLTSTYQGYYVDEGRTSLVFDKNPKYLREGFPELVIYGNPDTLEIGKEYTLEYSIPKWEKIFPGRKKIRSIK